MANESQMSLEDKAIQILAEQILKAVNSSDSISDKTYMSVVTNVNSDGTYVIRDRFGIERNVRSGLPNLKIGRGATVWIKEPEGNTNKLHICGVNAGVTTTTAASGNVYGTPSYNGGNNSNVINVDLSNYYTKAQINSITSNLSSDINTNLIQYIRTELNKYYTKEQTDDLLVSVTNNILDEVTRLLHSYSPNITTATTNDILSIFN